MFHLLNAFLIFNTHALILIGHFTTLCTSVKFQTFFNEISKVVIHVIHNECTHTGASEGSLP